MASKDRREREREETRGKILEAAREMFVANGVEAVTMRAIAERIEYTPTAIYHHFRDKNALITELVQRDFAALARKFASVGRIDDPVERVRRFGQGYVDFALEHPSHYRFMFMTPESRFGGLGEDGNDAGVTAYAFLRDTVAECIATGRFRPEYDDVELVAQMLWAAVHGVASLHITKKGDGWFDWRDAQQTSGLMCAAMFAGMLRPGDPALGQLRSSAERTGAA